MGLTISLDGLPVTVPDAALDALTRDVEARLVGPLHALLAAPAQTPQQAVIRTAAKVAANAGLGALGAKVREVLPGYPPPAPPRHCDILDYLAGYLTGAAHEVLTRLRAELTATVWEVTLAETGTGLQVAAITALDPAHPGADPAARGGAGAGADRGGADPPAADDLA